MLPSIKSRSTALRLTLVSLAVSAVLAGCSHQEQKRPTLSETFSTETSDDRSQRFVYSVSPDHHAKKRRPPRDGGSHQQRTKPAGKNDSNRQKKIVSAAEEMLESKLEETKFCQAGYTVLDSHFDRGRYTIRGECRDGANELESDNG